MKPFNLKNALNGDPVITRDGKEVTQITSFNVDGNYPLVGVVEGQAMWFTDHGKCCKFNNFDLFMAPKMETKWLVYVHGENGSYFFISKKQAEIAATFNKDAQVISFEVEV